MTTAQPSRFPIVTLLDVHGKPTGMVGQLFARVIDVNGNDTNKYAVMLTHGGQGCKHWPAEHTQIVEARHGS